MSGLKPYTILVACHFRRSRVFLLVLPKGQKHISQKLNIGSTKEKKILFAASVVKQPCNCDRRPSLLATFDLT